MGHDFHWTFPVKERIVFNTNILQSHDRTEQRIAKRRGVPAVYISTGLLAKGEINATKLENIIHYWLKKPWLVPFWPLATIHSDVLLAGSDTITINTRYSGYEEGGYALIWESVDKYEWVEIESVANDELVLTDTTVNDYLSDQFIVPNHIGYIFGPIDHKRYSGGIIASITWRIEYIETVSGFVEDMTYDGYTVLIDPAIIHRAEMEYEHDPDFAILDAGTGPFEIVSNSDYNQTGQLHGWVCRDKQAAWRLRQFLHDVKGSQKAFLVPTFNKDLQLTRPAGTADTEIYIANTNLTNMLGVNDMRQYVAFRLSSGEIIVRKITDISEVSEDEEKITLNAATGDDFNAGDYLCWVDRCRLADDEVELNWFRRGKCMADTPLIRVKN